MASAHLQIDLRSDLLSHLAQSRAETDELFRIVKPEALYDRPIAERHRIVFYIGHLEAFDWNLLAGRAFDLKPFHPEFDKLFAFGIDPVDGGLPTDQPSDWPPPEQVYDYCARIREHLDASLGRAIVQPREPDGRVLETLLNVAIEHRLMHAETLAYMFHQLPLDRKIAMLSAPRDGRRAVAHRTIEIPAGIATLGRRREASDGFGWDNEFEAHSVTVPAFTIDRYGVTNGDFLEFVRAGGYQDRSLWTGDAWEWIASAGIRHPQFWTERNGEWFYRTMFDERPLPLAWPVYVSHAEASAYALRQGRRLPTEAEWHRAAYATREGDEREYPWSGAPPGARFGNFDFASWNPTAVDAHPEGASAFGVEDLMGNGWEWTSTPFAPFPGFKPFPFYPGYSANFFDGKHYVMKGGSARTAACMLRRSFRNWFQPHYPYVYAGFRLVGA